MSRVTAIAIVISVFLCTSVGCSGAKYPLTHKLGSEVATPPADESIVGTWRFAKAGDHNILFPFIIKFDKHGNHTSGPTPYSLTQKSNYTFDGTTIVIGDGEEQVLIPDVQINGRVMHFYGEDGGEPILLTYHRIARW